MKARLLAETLDLAAYHCDEAEIPEDVFARADLLAAALRLGSSVAHLARRIIEIELAAQRQPYQPPDGEPDPPPDPPPSSDDPPPPPPPPTDRGGQP